MKLWISDGSLQVFGCRPPWALGILCDVRSPFSEIGGSLSDWSSWLSRDDLFEESPIAFACLGEPYLSSRDV